MLAKVIPIRRRAPVARYQVELGPHGRIALVVNGAPLDSFSVDQASDLQAALGAAVLLARGEDDVRAGRVAVCRGSRRIVARLVEHRGTAVLLDGGEAWPQRWFSLTDGGQVERSAARCRWAIEEPHRKALRLVRTEGRIE